MFSQGQAGLFLSFWGWSQGGGPPVLPGVRGRAPHVPGGVLGDGLVALDDHDGAAAPAAPIELEGGHVEAPPGQHAGDLTDAAGLVGVVDHQGGQLPAEGGVQSIHLKDPDAPAPRGGGPHLQLSAPGILKTDEGAVGVDVPQDAGAEGEGQPPLPGQTEAVWDPAVGRGEAQQPGHQGLVVPWPSPVEAKEPWSSSWARTGSCPSRARAMRPMRTAPAVWELEGPTMTGPRMSNRFIGVFLRCDLM